MATSGTNPQWYYMDDFSKWQPYNPHSNALLENAYLSGAKSINLSKNDARMNYTVDLVKFQQQNNRYGTVRGVKRDETGTIAFSVPNGVPKAGSATPPIKSHPSTAIPFKYATMPPKSGTIPGTSMLTPSAPPADPYFYPGRPISAPSHLSIITGTTPSTIVPITDTQPMPKPRNKKRGKSELRKPTSYDTFLQKYTETKEKEIPKDETCPICLTPLLEPADVDVSKKSISSGLPKEDVLALKKCSHMFHTICIGTMLDAMTNDKISELSISCPICQTIHGVKTGDQPRTGTMNVTKEWYSVPGHEGHNTHVIQYNFSDGVTETGTKFNAAGFPRVCYIPDCPEGRVVLELLRLAWNRRLIFTIGTSVTTGRANCIVWNNIHHKTEPQSNSSGHGFPDPNFLKNIKMELAVQGVTEDELK